MSTAYKIITNVSPPRVFPLHREILQLSKDIVVGDWFLFKDYIEIEVYGSELPPYQLLMFMPTRIFSLGFIRHSLNLDQIHFVPAKKGYIFKLPRILSPFVVNFVQAF